MEGKISVSELHVLVHPHYSINTIETPAGGRSDFTGVKVRKTAGQLFEKRGPAVRDTFSSDADRIDEAGLKQLEAMHRLYRHQIKRIAKTPGAHLVIVRLCYESPARRRPTTFPQYIDSFEPRLVAFARRKLGKRVTFLHCTPKNIGPQVTAIFGPQVGVNLFGEYNDACVEVAKSSLLESGYNVVVCKEKGVGV